MIWQKASTVFLENVEHWKRLKNNFETIFHEHYMFLTEKHKRIKSVKNMLQVVSIFTDYFRRECRV